VRTLDAAVVLLHATRRIVHELGRTSIAGALVRAATGSSPRRPGHGQSDAPHEASFYGEATMARTSRCGRLLGTEQFDLVGYAGVR